MGNFDEDLGVNLLYFHNDKDGYFSKIK